MAETPHPEAAETAPPAPQLGPKDKLDQLLEHLIAIRQLLEAAAAVHQTVTAREVNRIIRNTLFAEIAAGRPADGRGDEA